MRWAHPRHCRSVETLEHRLLLAGDSCTATLAASALDDPFEPQPVLAADAMTAGDVPVSFISSGMSEIFSASLDTPLVAGVVAAPASGEVAAAASTLRLPSGNYLMRPDTGTLSLPSSLLTNPNISGFVLRDVWRLVNPAPGVYDWSRLDAAIATVTAAGKQFKLVVYPGVESPSWIYAAGARSMTFQETGAFRPAGTYTMPVPWDPVMLSAYGDLLREMGRHFGDNPALVAVGVGGPTRYSLEMHLPPEVLNLPDASVAALTQAWQTVLEAYKSSFADVPAALHLANPFHFSDGIASAVAQKAVEILGDHLLLQHDALSAKSDLPSYNIHQMVSAYSLAGVHAGFEELTASNQARFGGSFEVAWQRLVAARGEYLDMYVPDDLLARQIPDFDHLGDMNYDGRTDNFDLEAFQLALTNSALYRARYSAPADYGRRGDANFDGVFTNFDIQAMEDVLTSGALPSAPASAPAVATAASVSAAPAAASAWAWEVAFSLAIEESLHAGEEL